MIPLVSSARARELDREAVGRQSQDALMESAARAMVGALRERYPDLFAPGGRPLLAVCGSGNNAGDALAVARMAAAAGKQGTLAVVPSGLGDAAARRLREARLAGVEILAPDDPRLDEAFRGAGLVLDGLCGVGLRGRLRPPLDGLALRLASASCPVAAVDLPSGVRAWEGPGDEPALPPAADCTLCVEPLKAELFYPGFRESAGTVIGMGGVFPGQAASECALLEAGDLAALLPPLPANAHKGTRGALGVWGGSFSGIGAARLASKAGSAAGAGTVTLMVGDEWWPAAASLDAQIARRLSDGPGRRLDAALAGPGWGDDDRTRAALDGLWAGALPLVLDADALGQIGGRGPRPSGAPLVLTPHAGEFARLASRSLDAYGDAAGDAAGDPAGAAAMAQRALYDTDSAALALARRFGAVVVLKNSVTWIACPDGSLAVWDGREPSLATGGSGDVLAGLIAGLLARGASAWDAARAGVIAHGLAGRYAARALGFYDASALVPEAARILYRGGRHGDAR